MVTVEDEGESGSGKEKGEVVTEEWKEEMVAEKREEFGGGGAGRKSGRDW